MNRIQKVYIYVLLFISVSLNASVNITNQVDIDHRIRNFAFAGPFQHNMNMDSLSKIISAKGFSFKKPLSVGIRSNEWRSYIATGSSGIHNVWQVYPDIKLDESIIAAAEVFSKNEQEIVLREVVAKATSEIWVNGSLKYISNDPSYNIPVRFNLLKGSNIILVKLISLGEPWFRLHFIPESRAEITGTITNVDGNPVPFAPVNIVIPSHNKVFLGKTDDKGDYTHIIFPTYEKEIHDIFVFGRDKRNSHKSIGYVKKGARLTINQTVKLRNSIKGKVLTPDGIGKQFGVVVQAIGLDDQGNENQNYIFTQYSDNEGSFEFNNLPNMKFHVRLHGRNDFEYLLDKNNRKRIFNLINTGNNYHDLKIKTPALAKGTWDKLGYLDGVLSDYSATNFIDQENKLWIGTWTGVTVYDGQETFSLNHENGLPKYPIWDIFQDKNNNIWASSGDGSIDKGGLVLIKDNKIEKVFTRADGLGGNSIGKLNQNLNGDLLIGGNGGFQIYDGKSFKVYNYTNGLANGYVRSYFVEGNSIWIGTLDGLVHYNGKKFKVYNVDDGLANNNIFTIRIKYVELKLE